MTIDKPNYTQTPNIVYDNMMKDLSEAELRVLLAIIRKTFGWSKTRDRISISQIQEMTGLSRQGVIDGKGGLVKKQIINEFRTSKGNEYEVNVVDQQNDQLVNTVDQTSQASRPKLVKPVDTQKKIKKLSKENISDSAESVSKKTKSDNDPKYIILRDKTREQFKKGFLTLTKTELTFDAVENTNLHRLVKEFINSPDTLYRIMKHLYTAKMKKDKEYLFNSFTPSGLYSARKRILSNTGGLSAEELSDLQYGSDAKKREIIAKVNSI